MFYILSQEEKDELISKDEMRIKFQNFKTSLIESASVGLQNRNHSHDFIVYNIFCDEINKYDL